MVKLPTSSRLNVYTVIGLYSYYAASMQLINVYLILIFI